jgi:hypothetical protein
MPLKLNVGLCRKIGQPNYGSRGADINLEVEIDTSLLFDPPKLRERIRELYGIVRSSLADELSLAEGTCSDGRANGRADSGTEAAGNGNGPSTANGNSQPRLATSSQVNALYGICKNRGLDLSIIIQERYRCDKPEQLSLREASHLIDDLRATS